MVAKDDFIIVLDFLPHGKPNDRRAEPVVQGVGDKYFNLLEVATKEGINIKTKQRLYIGSEKREEVAYIRDRITYDQLTTYAKGLLEEVVTELIGADEKRFVDIFNKAGPVTTRMHSLELLPGIGKKHLFAILAERKKKPFESFADLHSRVPMMPDAKKMIVRRIVEELQEKDRHRLFVASDLV
jgi:putative nucleotide binding protein